MPQKLAENIYTAATIETCFNLAISEVKEIICRTVLKAKTTVNSTI